MPVHYQYEMEMVGALQPDEHGDVACEVIRSGCTDLQTYDEVFFTVYVRVEGAVVAAIADFRKRSDAEAVMKELNTLLSTGEAEQDPPTRT